MKEISIIYDGEDFRMVISEAKPKSESMELPDGKKIYFGTEAALKIYLKKMKFMETLL